MEETQEGVGSSKKEKIFSKLKERFKSTIEEASKNKIHVVFLCLLLGAFILIGLPVIMQRTWWKSTSPIRLECQLPAHFRLNCLMRGLPSQYTKSNCEEKLNCCWLDDEPLSDTPRCFHSVPSPFHYKVDLTDRQTCEKDTAHNDTDKSKTVRVLTLEADPSAAVKSKNYLPINVDYVRLKMKVYYINEKQLMVKYVKALGYDFQPENYLGYGKFSPKPDDCWKDDSKRYDYKVDTAERGKRFYLNVKRSDDTKRSIINTDFGATIFADQYIEFTIILPTNSRLYGLGQSGRTSLLHSFDNGSTWDIFNRDRDDSLDSNVGGNSAHPFYMCVEEDGKVHGVLLAHTNIIEVTLTGIPAVTFRSTGSSMTFHVFTGPSPRDVIRQLTDLIGKPAFPPYWAFGHHVCRSFEKNYKNEFEEVELSVLELSEFFIPQESDCIFVSDEKFPWSLNASAWNSIVEVLKEKGIKITLVHRPQVDAEEYDSEHFVLHGIKKNYVGKWNDKNVKYLNVFEEADQRSKFVSEQIQNYTDVSGVKFSGLILTDNIPNDNSSNCIKNRVTQPPFLLSSMNHQNYLELLNRTICLDAGYSSNCKPIEDKNSQLEMRHPYHYNLHNLYGHAHAKIAYLASTKYLKNNTPFVLTLSSFTGTGCYAGQWGGKIKATWAGLQSAVVQMLEFNLYGIPFTGFPACGYTGEVDRDLCSRWVQLSAFQPLSLTFRRYTRTPSANNQQYQSQHPFLQDDLIKSVAAAALKLRLSLLPYFYTVFYRASKSGDPVVRPLFYEWPNDENAYLINDQFMWGSALMVSPVLYPATTKLRPYFPKGTWYDFYGGSLIHIGEEGKNVEVVAHEYHINLHIRGGSIISSHLQGQTNTEKTRNQDFRIQVALEQTGNKKDDEVIASGELYIDDGNRDKSLLVEMNSTRRKLTLTPSGDLDACLKNKPTEYSVTLDTIFVIGLMKSHGPDCEIETAEGNSTLHSCHHDADQAVLSLRNITIDLRCKTTIFYTKKAK